MEKRVKLKCLKTLRMRSTKNKAFTKGKTYLVISGQKADTKVIDDEGDEHYLGEWHRYFTIVIDKKVRAKALNAKR